MFDITEFTFMTRLINQPYYLSPKSTFEYIMFNDIDNYEFIVDFDIDNWLSKVKKKHHIQVIKENNVYSVVFHNESISVKLYNLQNETMESYLNRANFNIESVALKVSHDEHNNFDHYYYSGKTYYCSWMDPYHKRLGIKASYIEPVNLQRIKDNGALLYQMAILMADNNFDVHPEVLKYIKTISYDLHCDSELCNDYFFKVLSYRSAYKYMKMLDEFGVLEKTYPIIKQMKKQMIEGMNLWQRALFCLKKLENIIYSDTYFVDSVSREIQRNANKILLSGLMKSQLLKFSILFYNAHLTMKLKINAPELYEESFTSFCTIFSLSNESCHYYAQVVQNNRKSIIDLREELLQGNSMSKINHYEFYEDFQDNTIDVLLIQYVDQICGVKFEDGYRKRLEFFVQNYISKFCEIQSINSEITTLEINTKNYSDASMLLLLDVVKRHIFLGNLRYDRQTIIEFINKIIKEDVGISAI